MAGTNSTDYYITDEVRDFDVRLQLPEDLECEHCVFQVGADATARSVSTIRGAGEISGLLLSTFK